jgi:hypothetical protein
MDDQRDLEWVPLVEYGAVYEAELAAGRLESVGILSRIDRRGAAGIFGLGHGGSSVRGVMLYVPEESVTEARHALDLEDEP